MTSLQLRSGPSGALFEGSAQNDTLLWDTATRKFTVGAIVVSSDNVENESSVAGDTVTDALNTLLASGGGGVPLTLEFWVDPGRVGSSEDGSIGQPFLTVQAAIDALSPLPGTIRLAAADYSAEDVTIAGPGAVTIIAGELATFNSLTLSTSVTLERVNTGAIAAAGVTIILRNCRTGVIQCSGPIGLQADFTDIDGINNISNLDSFTLRDCTVLGDVIFGEVGTLRARDSVFGSNLHLNIVELEDCQVAGDVGAVQLTLNQTKIDGAVTITPSGDTEFLHADSYSLTQLRRNGETHSFSHVAITDRPYSQGVFVVPAILAGASADVTISGAGLFGKPGDVIVTSLATSVAVPRLAGVGISSAWIEPGGGLTVRFTGATAGGNQLVDFNILFNESL